MLTISLYLLAAPICNFSKVLSKEIENVLGQRDIVALTLTQFSYSGNIEITSFMKHLNTVFLL